MAKNKYRFGFKAEANRWAIDLRHELNMRSDAPLCPWKLCDHLEIPIIKLSDLPPTPQTSYLMSLSGMSQFSATVCFSGEEAFIVTNDVHPIKRQASNLAHEVAHVLLRHPPTAPFDETGSRTFLKEFEDEAEWLGPSLLISDDAAMYAYAETMGIASKVSALSDKWNITQEVIKMRMNVVGAAGRFQRKFSKD